MPPSGERVVATGLCSWCEFKFTNEVVARYPEPAAPGGWAYVELRHLEPGALAALDAADDLRRGPAESH
jgi:hypothetical protein